VTATVNSRLRPSVAERSAAAIRRKSEPARDQQDQGRDLRDEDGRPAPGGKGDDEAQQIEAEWNHPEQGHSDDVGGEVRRRRQHQAGGDGGKRHPVKDAAGAGGRRDFGRDRFDDLRRNGQRAPRDEQHQQRVAARPEQALLLQREQRLDDQRVRDQPREAAEIGRGVKGVGLAAAALERVPALHQGRLRRNDEEKRPDRGDEEPGYPQGRREIGGRLYPEKADRQPERRDREQGEMEPGLPARAQPPDPVGIGIAAEQQRLIDQHRAVPDRRRAAEPRQCHARDHRLSEEEQERAGDDRSDEQRPGETIAAGERGGVGRGQPSSRAARGAW
jgi:hypothetical protein